MFNDDKLKFLRTYRIEDIEKINSELGKKMEVIYCKKNENGSGAFSLEKRIHSSELYFRELMKVTEKQKRYFDFYNCKVAGIFFPK